MQKIADHLIHGIAEYFKKNGFSRAVLGISGGVDSALTAALAVQALGAKNVVGLLMPHGKFSSPENLADARELVTLLEMHSEEIWIDSAVASFWNLPWVSQQMTQANILARVRMVILYSWANEHDALVLGTCNKSETLLGYETKFGDGAADLSVLGEVWKTDVWKLATYLGLPEKFVQKSPSAELWAEHTDETEMGFSYTFADDVLQKWEQGKEIDETDERVQEILRRIRVHAHKRKAIPIIAL